MLILITACVVRGTDVNDYYRIDNIPSPKGLEAQIGGIAFLPDGPTISPSNKIFIIYLFELIIPCSVKI